MMDVSFDVFAGGNGWADVGGGGNDMNSSSSTQRYNMFEKIPLPVTVDSLLEMPEGEEKYKISNYTFNTIKLVGAVSSIHSDQDKTCITYELCKPGAGNIKIAPHFTVIRYLGAESNAQKSVSTFDEGAVVQAVGKLRSFNNRLSLVTFYIGELTNKEEIELFEDEAKLAHMYYGKNFPEQSVNCLNEIGLPFLSCSAPVRDAKPGNMASQMSMGGRSQMSAVTNGTSNSHQSMKQPASNQRGLTGQQARIYEYIRLNGISGNGISTHEITSSIDTDENFLKDLNYLLGEGIIYNTLDDDHYSVIE